MVDIETPEIIRKTRTYIPGFDFITMGGVPKERVTLVSGTAGSAKTILAVQFLIEGIRNDNEGGVFVTFEESPSDIRRNMLGFGWDIAELERANKWAFVDGTVQFSDETMHVSSYDLRALVVRIEHAIETIGAKRLSLDSLGAVFDQFPDADSIRRDLFRTATAIRDLGVTAIMTSERLEEYGQISRHGIEEFVSDNVIVVRNALDDEKRRRTIEILKFRGTDHHKGEFPFSVVQDRGIVVIPVSDIEGGQNSPDDRLSSGNPDLDEMSGGGFFKDSVTLVSGATGTGKTLMVTEFVAEVAATGGRSLLFAFEESRSQLFRNARGWGADFDALERDGLLRVECMYPEGMGLENHLIRIQQAITDFRPTRVAIDSLSALERISSFKGFREFVIGLTAFIKQIEIAGLFTYTTATLTGRESESESLVAAITDTIILLRYVEIYGAMRRGIALVKMRGSSHDEEIREFSIDTTGLHVGKQFKNVGGILTGTAVHISSGESDRLAAMFTDDEPT